MEGGLAKEFEKSKKHRLELPEKTPKKRDFKPPKELAKLWHDYTKDFRGRFEDAAKINRMLVWNSFYSGDGETLTEATFDRAFFDYLSGRISREQAIDRLRKTELLAENKHPNFLKTRLERLGNPEKAEGLKEQPEDSAAPEKKGGDKKWLPFVKWIKTQPLDIRNKAYRRAAFFKHLSEDKPEGVDTQLHRLNFLSEVQNLIDFKEVDELHNLVYSRNVIKLGEKNQKIAERKYAEAAELRRDFEKVRNKRASQKSKLIDALKRAADLLKRERAQPAAPDSEAAKAEIYRQAFTKQVERVELTKEEQTKANKLEEALKAYRQARTQMVGVLSLSGQIDTEAAKEELLNIYAHVEPRGKPVVDAITTENLKGITKENLEDSSRNPAEKRVQATIRSLLDSMQQSARSTGGSNYGRKG